MNIRVDLNTPIKDGTEVVFRSPVDCSQVTGLIVYYPENSTTTSKEFAFADAHGNNVGDIDHLFAENVVVKVILDVTTSMAFVQNADTNAYLEGRFKEKNRTIISSDPVEEDHDFSTPYGFDNNALSAMPKQGDLIIDHKGNAYTAVNDGVDSEDGFNINVLLKYEGNITGMATAVLYTPQTLPPAQQAQARQNMGVLNPYVIPVNTSEDTSVIECEFNWDELVSAVKAGSYVACMTYNSQESYGKPASDASVNVFPLNELSIEDGIAWFERDSILFKATIEIRNDGTLTQRSVNELDKTLTKSGRAADAAVVGEKLGDIENALDGIIALQEEMIGGDSV